MLRKQFSMASNLIISFLVFIIFALVMPLFSLVEGGLRSNVLSRLSDEVNKVGNCGTKWAVLVGGSNGFSNYRHQADVCHAYHILKKGGLKDENIIVFMYDDIAFNKENPVPGVIINNPHGKDVYRGVIKDYTGKDVNTENLYAIILGNETAVKGGSGKVLKSGPNDHVFIYYTDHVGAGILGMPDDVYVYANDLIEVLKKKHAASSYKSMVIYVEACESGSIFDGLLPGNLSIYVTTAAKPDENSWACYCGGPGSLRLYHNICLGDLYSVAWLEDSDKYNSKETLQQQYLKVKERAKTGQEGVYYSHVMQYGNMSISNQRLAVYMGATSSKGSSVATNYSSDLYVVEQREADLFYLREKVKRATEGSDEWLHARMQLDEAVSHRVYVDESVAKIGEHLFGSRYVETMYNVRPAVQPLVDDWDCFKALVKVYEEQCGSLRDYGRKYMRAFANICNAGIKKDLMTQVSTQICWRGQKGTRIIYT